MRKYFLTITFIFASLGLVFSQGFSSPPCVVSPIDTGLITPSYDSIACVETGLPYSSSVQINIPALFNSNLLIDSLVITSISGLPAGLSYQQYPASGVYYGNSTGCIAIVGTTNADSGSYPLLFSGYAVISTTSSDTLTYNFTQFTQIQDAPVPTYQLHIINPGDSCFTEPLGYYYTSGIRNLLSQSQLNVYPNPSAGSFNLELNTGKNITGDIQITDVTGRIVYLQTLNTNGFYKSTINLANCANGFYLLQIKTPQGIVAKSISIQ